MVKYFGISSYMYQEALLHKRVCNCSILSFLLQEVNLIFIFISVYLSLLVEGKVQGEELGREVQRGGLQAQAEQGGVRLSPNQTKLHILKKQTALLFIEISPKQIPRLRQKRTVFRSCRTPPTVTSKQRYSYIKLCQTKLRQNGAESACRQTKPISTS